MHYTSFLSFCLERGKIPLIAPAPLLLLVNTAIYKSSLHSLYNQKHFALTFPNFKAVHYCFAIL